MQTRRIAGRDVGALGLGCMGMSFAYGPADQDESLRTLARALDLGVDHWDTADLYGVGENERLLSQALRENRDRVFLATKFGNVMGEFRAKSHRAPPAPGAEYWVDGTPAYARQAVESSLQRLGVDHVDLYYLHRVDPQVPIEETWGEMARFVKEGKVRALGISEAAADTIRRAHAVYPVAAVQSEYSLWTRDYEQDAIPLCCELNIAFVPYSPLGRGFLTGQFRSPDDLPEGDWRRSNPRFQGESLRRNLALADAVGRIAGRVGHTPAQVALAWVLGKGDDLLPIPGTKRVRYLEENAAAAEVRLAPEDVAELDALPQAEGERYPEGMMERVNL